MEESTEASTWPSLAVKKENQTLGIRRKNMYITVSLSKHIWFTSLVVKGLSFLSLLLMEEIIELGRVQSRMRAAKDMDH